LSTTPLTIKLRSNLHVEGDHVEGDEYEWDEKNQQTLVKADNDMEVEAEEKEIQNVLPSQEDIIEDFSPIAKRHKSEVAVSEISDTPNWIPELDQLFLRLQIGISFIQDYDFVEKESTPLDRAISILQSSDNYLKYRDKIETIVKAIKKSVGFKKHRHYRRAFTKVIDQWDALSDCISSKYMALKNKIPQKFYEEILKNIEEPEINVDERIEVIYSYLTRNREVAIHRLVDAFAKYVGKHPDDLSISSHQKISDIQDTPIQETPIQETPIQDTNNISIILNMTDLEKTMEQETQTIETHTEVVQKEPDLEKTMEQETQTIDVTLTGVVLTVSLSDEQLLAIGSTFNTAILYEPEYENPRQEAIGIANTGNSCFMNSILQMIWRIKVSLLQGNL
jgi:hypothetical protein